MRLRRTEQIDSRHIAGRQLSGSSHQRGQMRPVNGWELKRFRPIDEIAAALEPTRERFGQRPQEFFRPEQYDTGDFAVGREMVGSDDRTVDFRRQPLSVLVEISAGQISHMREEHRAISHQRDLDLLVKYGDEETRIVVGDDVRSRREWRQSNGGGLQPRSADRRENIVHGLCRDRDQKRLATLTARRKRHIVEPESVERRRRLRRRLHANEIGKFLVGHLRQRELPQDRCRSRQHDRRPFRRQPMRRQLMLKPFSQRSRIAVGNLAERENGHLIAAALGGRVRRHLFAAPM